MKFNFFLPVKLQLSYYIIPIYILKLKHFHIWILFYSNIIATCRVIFSFGPTTLVHIPVYRHTACSSSVPTPLSHFGHSMIADSVLQRAFAAATGNFLQFSPLKPIHI